MTPASRTTPLAGIRVLDLSTTTAGALVTRFLADYGAEVIQVEPPGGTRLRELNGYPYLGRGKQSVVLDLHRSEPDRASLRSLAATTDCLVTTWRPGVAAGLGLSYEQLVRTNPGLIGTEITGFGNSGPWRDLKGYEALVLAKLGVFHNSRRIVERAGPAYVAVPYASWGAAMGGVQGVLCALIEREASGLGQLVESNLVQGLDANDCWNWFVHMIGTRYPGAYQTTDLYTDEGEPAGHFVFPLLVAQTSDGAWLQFAQTQSHLFKGFMDELGLGELFTDPYWAGLPMFEDRARRVELWELMLERVGERSLAEWERVFETNSLVSAEQFRRGHEVFDHPQLRHDGRSEELDDPNYGRIRVPSTLVNQDEQPFTTGMVTAAVDEHGEHLRDLAAALPEPPAAVQPASPAGLPLSGVTIVEFAVMFAAPHGSTMLADLGARVIKVEAIGGDPIRNLIPVPEVASARVMQGKESICLDLTTEQGAQIVRELIGRADVVLMGFRAGAAERAGVDPESVLRLNPGCVYLSAPGYGTGGPFGARAAYAPSIGAAAGFSLASAPDARADEPIVSLDLIKRNAVRLASAGTASSVTADGIAALGVSAALLLGLLAKRRGVDLPPLTTSMLSTASHAMFDFTVHQEGRPEPRVLEGGYGVDALYRLYEAADGWVFLAAPEDREWDLLTKSLDRQDLADDPRFRTRDLRREHDAELGAVLADVFAQRPARAWEEHLTGADVGCAVAEEWPTEEPLKSQAVGRPSGWVVDAVSSVWDEHERLAPLVRFSRSATRAPGGCAPGEHTDALLAELGRTPEGVAELRAAGVVG